MATPIAANTGSRFNRTVLDMSVTDITNAGNITCTIAANTLTRGAVGGSVAVGATTGRFDVVVSVRPDTSGVLNNPRGGGNCWADPSAHVTESSESNNYCNADAVTVGSTGVYLPLVFRSYVSAPDLVVQDIIATSSNVQVVVRNRGNAPVVDEFWVDVYVNPNPVPTGVNQTWDQLADEGPPRGVTADALPLAPGDVLTLTVGDAYYVAEYSQVVWPLQAGRPVYAQVDSANTETTYGGVRESHEIVGRVYNNISGPVYSAAAWSGAESPAMWGALPAWYGDSPRRP
jgi:hypothetical protein